MDAFDRVAKQLKPLEPKTTRRQPSARSARDWPATLLGNSSKSNGARNWYGSMISQ